VLIRAAVLGLRGVTVGGMGGFGGPRCPFVELAVGPHKASTAPHRTTPHALSQIADKCHTSWATSYNLVLYCTV
jgi:hypothetical protein